MFEEEINNYLKTNDFEIFNPKVVLFDMDGTLYNSMPNHAIAWTRSMKHFGLPFTIEDAYLTEGMKGTDTIRAYMKRESGKEISEEKAQKMYDLKAKIFHELPETQIFDGVFELMRKIKASGLKIGIVTGSGQKQLIDRLALDFHGYLNKEEIVSAFNTRHGKPAPDPFLSGLRITGNFKPWEAIAIENAPLGAQSSVSAGIFTVVVNTGPLPDSAFIEKGANTIFKSIGEFSKHWNQLIH